MSLGSRGLCNLRFYRSHVNPRGTWTRRIGSRSDFFRVSDEVEHALQTSRPVVALETTIYTHGFPYPENVALSSHLESLVRVNGAIPATIGVLNGVARIGMQAEELIELISTAGKPDTMKVSRRDLAFITGLGLAGQKFNGGTTVAATMLLANLAGIKVFATGGLGGVHRSGQDSLDISADLTELGRTPIAVISAGCKSFLDLPRTLEYLETQGVGVATFADGRDGSVNLPAFYVRDSGIKSPKTIKDELEAAAIIYAQSRLPVHSGLWFAGPVPAKESLSKEEVDEWVALALDEAESNGIHGAANTPYILGKIKQLSDGRSVIANKAGVAANVVRGTKIAVELAKFGLQEKSVLDRKNGTKLSTPSVREPESQRHGNPLRSSAFSLPGQDRYDVLVAGALAADLGCEYAPLQGFHDRREPLLHTSNPAIFTQNVGGVGHNVALAAHYGGALTLLCSVVGNDATGRSLVEQVRRRGLPTSGIQTLDVCEDGRSAQYVAVYDQKKDLVIAMADMSIFSSVTTDTISFWEKIMTQHQPRWVVIDANWSREIMLKIITAAKSAGARIAFEPVSNEKSSRLVKLLEHHTVIPNHIAELAAPNALELQTMHSMARERLLFESQPWWQIIHALNLSGASASDRLMEMTSPELVHQGIPQQCLQLLPYIPCILTKLGAQGCLLLQILSRGDPRLRDPSAAPYILGRITAGTDSGEWSVGGVYVRLFPPAEVVKQHDVVSVNGVGDTLLGVLVAGLSMERASSSDHASTRSYVNVEDILMVAQQAAVRSLKDKCAVSEKIRGILA